MLRFREWHSRYNIETRIYTYAYLYSTLCFYSIPSSYLCKIGSPQLVHPYSHFRVSLGANFNNQCIMNYVKGGPGVITTTQLFNSGK